MATILKNLVPGSQLTTSAASYYAAAIGVSATVKNCTVTNSTAGSVTFTLYLVPPSGTAGVTNEVIAVKSVAANETYCCPEMVGKNVMSSGSIQALASAGASLTLMVSGLELS